MIQPFAGRGGWSSETPTTPSSPSPRTNYWESSTAEGGNRRGRGTTANRRGALAFLRLFTVFGRTASSAAPPVPTATEADLGELPPQEDLPGYRSPRGRRLSRLFRR